VGPDYPALLLAITEATYHPPSFYDERWPLALDAWFAKSFRVDRETRFRGADEAGVALAVALSELGDTQPAGADHALNSSWPSSPGFSAPPSGRHSWTGVEPRWPERRAETQPSWDDDEDDKTAPRQRR
jgi:hypothetical protein